MKHLRLEPLVHTMLCPLCISIEVEIPIIDTRNMNTIPVQLNHIQMIAAVIIAVLVLDYDEERVW